MKIVVSGAAGFIGCHAVDSFLRRGDTVIGFDNLSRKGSAENLSWLTKLDSPGQFAFERADIRNRGEMLDLFARHRDADAVLHFAAQVAVTTSVEQPQLDFDTNALGTFNLLESIRTSCPGAILLFSSTNKVYGQMLEQPTLEHETRYAYQNLEDGVAETEPLDFHSPYGCSKGAADQYVRDYARVFGLKAVVFRQSCIYGTRQFGVEDQGWLSWFTIASVTNRPATVYGDGKQVRDVLWIDDLMSLYVKAIERIDVASGQIYNTGGGPGNTISVNELLTELGRLTGAPIKVSYSDWRTGDQKIYVSNIAKARAELDWVPKVSPKQGIEQLLEWTESNKDIINSLLQAPNSPSCSVKAGKTVP